MKRFHKKIRFRKLQLNRLQWKFVIGCLILLVAVVCVGYYKFSADTIGGSKYYGCLNNTDSKCIHLVNNSENGITVSSLSNLGAIDGTFRSVLAKKTVIISIPAFNVDTSGFPLSDMMLEVKFKDTVAASTTNRTQIFQEIDYGSNEYENVASLALGDKGDSSVKINQALFEKNGWQRLRSIKGMFNFKIIGASADMPIEYLALTKISHTDVETFKKWQRDVYKGLKEEEYVETNKVPSFSGDFATYTSSTSRQIFPNTIPTAQEINKDINISSALGEYEPIPISVYTKKTLNNVTVSISDLVSSKDKIPISAIQVRKVVYDYKIWPNSNYGIQPDRIEKFDKIAISANSSQQFWLTVAVPKTISGGAYAGTITIKPENGQSKVVKVVLDVLPMQLKNTKQVNAIYFAPQNKTYALNNSAVFADMKEHEINSLIDSFKTVTIDITNRTLTFDTSTIKGRLQESVNEGVLVDTMLYTDTDSLTRSIITKLNAFYSANTNATVTIDGQSFPDSPAWRNYGTAYDFEANWKKMNDPRFKKAFESAIKQLIADGKSVNPANGGIKMEFLAIDEPNADKVARAYSDREYRYIKEAGGTTWVTYTDDCKKEVECPECQPCPECTIKDGKTYLPSLAGLIDNKAYEMYYVKAASAADDKNSFGFYDTNYSQLRNPVSNRFIHGLFAQKADARVTPIYAYGDFSSDPYNDFDSQSFYKYPDFILAYPTWNPNGEMVPTMAWEGLREGIKDDKYIETLKDLIDKNPNSAKAKEASAYLNNVLNKISLDWQSFYRSDTNAYIKTILRTVSAGSLETDYTAFDTVRKTTIQYIKDLYVPPTPPVIIPPTTPTDPTTTTTLTDTTQNNTTPSAGGNTIPSGQFKTGWNMVSFPLSESVETSKLIPAGYKIREYNAATNSYIVPTQIVPGRGYWLKIDDVSKWANTTYMANSGSTSTLAVSKKGWLLLGNQNASDYPISKISIHFKNGSKKTFEQAANNNDISGYGWSYEKSDNSYHFVSNNVAKYLTSAKKQTTIAPFRGIWLFVNNVNIDQVILNP